MPPQPHCSAAPPRRSSSVEDETDTWAKAATRAQYTCSDGQNHAVKRDLSQIIYIHLCNKSDTQFKKQGHSDRGAFKYFRSRKSISSQAPDPTNPIMFLIFYGHCHSEALGIFLTFFPFTAPVHPVPGGERTLLKGLIVKSLSQPRDLNQQPPDQWHLTQRAAHVD